MVPLTRHCVRALAVSMAVVLVLAIGAAAVRLLPWLLSPHVPIAVALPFAQALLVVAAEAAFVVGAPVGIALGTALLVERGEARALHCSGVSPLGLTVRALPLLLFVAGAAALVATSWPSNADKPGRFAAVLIEQGKLGCLDGAQQSVAVPFVGVTWLCFPAAPPRVVGPVPKAGGSVWFSAGSLAVADDFTTFDAEDVFVASGQRESDFKVALRVGRAHVTGLPAWGQSTGFQVGERAALVALLLTGLGLCSVFVTSQLALVQPVVAATMPGLAGALSLRALHQAPSAHPTVAAAEVLAVGLGVCLAPLALIPIGRWAYRHVFKEKSP